MKLFVFTFNNMYVDKYNKNVWIKNELLKPCLFTCM